MTTFAEQATEFLKVSETRKRSPVRQSTLQTYKLLINKHLTPLLGELPLEKIDNKALKSLVSEMSGKGLKAATVGIIVNVLKQVLASSINENGDPRHPRTWNSDFIDLPMVENQRQPVIDANALESTIQRSLQAGFPGDAVLYALLAGSGLRIGEALGILAFDNGISNYWDGEKVIVRSQRDSDAPKTKAGNREVDLCPELNAFIKRYEPKEGPLFPLSESMYRTRATALGIPGFHSLRRFRVTHLDNESVPNGLLKYWVGHAASNISEKYTKVGGMKEMRREWTNKVALGFKLNTLSVLDILGVQEAE